MKRAYVILFYIMSAVSCQTANAETSWRFIVITDTQRGFECCDSGINDIILKEIVVEILDSNVDFVLIAGDLTNGSGSYYPQELPAWRSLMQPVYDVGIGVYPCRGNHDNAADDIGLIWQANFGDLPGNGPNGQEHMTYSVTHKNAFIVALDAYSLGCFEGVNQHRISQAWLDTQLASNSSPHVFIFAHEPAFKASHSDCLDDCPADRDIFWQSIIDAGGRTYFCGHDHHFNHVRIDDGDKNPDNDVHQFICGSAGGTFYDFIDYDGDNNDWIVAEEAIKVGYGYVLGEVDNLEVTLTWIQRNTDNLDVAGIYEPNEIWSYNVAADIRLLTPNGGEKLVSGSSTITWQTKDSLQIENIDIELSLNNGQSWEYVDTSPNVGSYLWNTVAVADSNECLIRITGLTNPSLSDTSDDVFTIFQCPEAIVGDLNQDCYIDFYDLAILASHWLECGNPFDSACLIE